MRLAILLMTSAAVAVSADIVMPALRVEKPVEVQLCVRAGGRR